jgi:hypothetical protein
MRFLDNIQTKPSSFTRKPIVSLYLALDYLSNADSISLSYSTEGIII